MLGTDDAGVVADAPPARSALFVPANRRQMLTKAMRSGADIVLADFEDSVPRSEKQAARETLADWLSDLPTADAPNVAVRINGLHEEMLDEDVAVCMHPLISTVMIPKVLTPSEIQGTADALERCEKTAGRQRPVFIWPTIETAAAVRNAYDIASSHARVRYVGGSAGDEGDLAQSVGFRWTPSFNESYFIRSKVLVDVRAAGIQNPITGVVTNISGTEEVTAFAMQSRDLGYAGMMVIHPSHVPVVNSIFGITQERIDWANEILRVLETAEQSGSGAIRHKGMMIDVAMASMARRVLKMAKQSE